MSNAAPPPPDLHALLRSVPVLVSELQQQNAALRRAVRAARWERWTLYLLFLLALSGGPPRCNVRTLTDVVAGGR